MIPIKKNKFQYQYWWWWWWWKTTMGTFIFNHVWPPSTHQPQEHDMSLGWRWREKKIEAINWLVCGKWTRVGPLFDERQWSPWWSPPRAKTQIPVGLGQFWVDSKRPQEVTLKKGLDGARERICPKMCVSVCVDLSPIGLFTHQGFPHLHFLFNHFHTEKKHGERKRRAFQSTL